MRLVEIICIPQVPYSQIDAIACIYTQIQNTIYKYLDTDTLGYIFILFLSNYGVCVTIYMTTILMSVN